MKKSLFLTLIFSSVVFGSSISAMEGQPNSHPSGKPKTAEGINAHAPKEHKSIISSRMGPFSMVRMGRDGKEDYVTTNNAKEMLEVMEHNLEVILEKSNKHPKGELYGDLKGLSIITQEVENIIKNPNDLKAESELADLEKQLMMRQQLETELAQIVKKAREELSGNKK